MLLLRLFPFIQLLSALKDSTLVQKISDLNAPCKSCKILVQFFEKVKFLSLYMGIQWQLTNKYFCELYV